jgi:hypothetical protein
MEMMTVRQSWSDDRIESLERKVDEGFLYVDKQFEHVDKQFAQVDKRFDRMDSELRALRGDMNSRFESFELRLGGVDGRFEALEENMRGFHRTLITFCIAMLAAFIGLIGTLLTVVLTQI